MDFRPTRGQINVILFYDKETRCPQTGQIVRQMRQPVLQTNFMPNPTFVGLVVDAKHILAKKGLKTHLPEDRIIFQVMIGYEIPMENLVQNQADLERVIK